jgi:hypothetical protein
MRAILGAEKAAVNRIRNQREFLNSDTALARAARSYSRIN